MSEDNDECLFHFTLTNDAGYPFVVTFDDTEPGSKANERIFFMGNKLTILNFNKYLFSSLVNISLNNEKRSRTIFKNRQQSCFQKTRQITIKFQKRSL